MHGLGVSGQGEAAVSTRRRGLAGHHTGAVTANKRAELPSQGRFMRRSRRLQAAGVNASGGSGRPPAQESMYPEV